MKTVVIVESPSKAKTINKYLGSDYQVLASYGHVRDLPSKDGSVDPNQNFNMVWEIDNRSKTHIDEIIKAIKTADQLFLATDPDREGEAISWHIKEVLNQKKVLKDISVKRVLFYEITKQAVLEAIKNPRDLNKELIEAYLARRALDYLVGFTLSPVLWRKLPGSKSAGRVQSVALRLIAEQEAAIEIFQSQEYWTIKADFENTSEKSFVARLTHLDQKKLEKFDIKIQQQALDIQARLETYKYKICSIDKKQVKRYPSPPFTTSTLQQEASRKLGFGARKTMQIAQKLYEGIALKGETVGLITYMRTDSVHISTEAISAITEFVTQTYGKKYSPEKIRLYKNKAKNAQEAHEAIRPTTINRTPESVKQYLDTDHYKLFDLIWRRTISSQMENAIFDQTAVDITNTEESVILRANGSILVFDGFLKLYEEGRDDDVSEENARLPILTVNEILTLNLIRPDQHFTQPPARFSEASLVKKLEELGIGRPSTYASIMSTLIERKYVSIDKKRLIPDALGRLVTAFLLSFFKQYIEYDFTAHLEEQLDDISEGKLQWTQVLDTFWHQFNHSIVQAKDLKISDVIDHLNQDLERFIFPPSAENASNAYDSEINRKCPSCSEGYLSLKLGKWGAFVGCSHYPTCAHTRRLTSQSTDEADINVPQLVESRILGQDPETQATITLKKGPYGFYIQWDNIETEEESKPKKVSPKTKKKSSIPKPKRVAVPKNISPQDITLEHALSLGALPRFVGNHPETGNPITAAIGRFGPYLKYENHFKSVNKNYDLLTISLEQAVNVLKEIGEKSDNDPTQKTKTLKTIPSKKVSKKPSSKKTT